MLKQEKSCFPPFSNYKFNKNLVGIFGLAQDCKSFTTCAAYSAKTKVRKVIPNTNCSFNLSKLNIDLTNRIDTFALLLHRKLS